MDPNKRLLDVKLEVVDLKEEVPDLRPSLYGISISLTPWKRNFASPRPNERLNL